jgi:hypothetical protein
MRWQGPPWLPIVLASAALAQELPPATTPPPAPAATAAEASACPSVPLSFPAGTRGDRLSGNHDFPNFINWISNPLENIDPRAVTAIYPVFLSPWTSAAPPVPQGDFQVYGAAITVALSDRFAMGLNQGGFADAHFSRNPADRARLIQQDPLGRFRDAEAGGSRDGWLNLGGFFQYTLIADVQDQFLVTGGLRWEVPCGAYEVFQGHGPVHLAPYLTTGKEFGNLHVLATTGYQFPAGPGNDTTQLFYSNLHIDRQTFGWLYPLVEVNSLYHTTGVDFGLPTRRGFIDLGNFEATGNVVALSVGANAVLIPEHLEIGAVYTTVIASQHDFGANGLLVKMTFRY